MTRSLKTLKQSPLSVTVTHKSVSPHTTVVWASAAEAKEEKWSKRLKRLGGGIEATNFN